MRWQTGLIGAFSACVMFVRLVSPGGAGENDEALVCQTDESFDCAPNSDCIEDDAEAIGLPSIVHVDLKSNKLVGTMSDGTDLKADFTGEVEKDGLLLVTGTQAGLGWSMTVARASGAMALAITGDDIAFVVFGSCAPD